MTEQRLSLEDAGKLLGGLHPNTVRARAQKGKIPYEKDNAGKWWVFLDPEKAANDTKAKPPKPLTMQPPFEPTIEPQIVSAFKALELTIESQRQELEVVRAERDTFKTRADEATRLEAEAAGLRVQLANLERHGEEAAATVKDLRARLDDMTDENRKLLASILEKMAVPAPAVAPDRAKRGWWPFGRSNG